MSIQSEINRITNHVSLAYDVALAMGATMPDIKNIENLASTISTISPTIDDSNGNHILDGFNRALRGYIVI